MIDENENVILVTESDEEIGVAPKLDAHRTGQLHRAFSIFVEDPEGHLLLQRRAKGKYHSAGLWANTCCGHPRPGEPSVDAASRRLREEMGLHCKLDHRSSFTYRAELGNGLVEHELDHVFTGLSVEDPNADPLEVSEWKWMSPDDIRAWMARDPDAFSAWFPQAFSEFSKSRA